VLAARQIQCWMRITGCIAEIVKDILKQYETGIVKMLGMKYKCRCGKRAVAYKFGTALCRRCYNKLQKSLFF
jgi:hypothetical protein